MFHVSFVTWPEARARAGVGPGLRACEGIGLETKAGCGRPPCVVRDAPSALLTMTYVIDSIEKPPHPRPAPGQALRKPQRGCLEGRTVPTQPSFNSLTRSCAGTMTGQAFWRRGGRWLVGPGDGVEVAEQGGDAARVGLVHDRAGRPSLFLFAFVLGGRLERAERTKRTG